MKTLILPNNKIADASNLAALTNLDVLRLDYNPDLASIEFMSALKNLTVLQLNSQPLLGSQTATLANLPLKQLTVNNIGLTSVEEIAKIATLDYLAISNNEVRDVSPLAALTNLTDLRAIGNQVLNFDSLGGLGLTTFYGTAQWATADRIAYIPVGATSYTHPIVAGELTAVDGSDAVFVASDTYTNTYTFDTENVTFTDLTADAEIIRAKFAHETARFSGRVAYEIVWSDFTNADPSPAVAGAAVAHEFTVTEGFPVQRFELADGALPAGVTLNENGTLSGTATEAGTFPITVNAVDAVGNTISHSYELVIEPAAIEQPTETAIAPTAVPVPSATATAAATAAAAKPGNHLAQTGNERNDAGILFGGVALLLAGAALLGFRSRLGREN